MMKYQSTTTLNHIRDAHPCAEGWRRLRTYLGTDFSDDAPLDVLTVLDSNGLEDALWVVNTLPDKKLAQHFQAWCAEQVLHIFEADRPNDIRVRDQITILRNDEASDEERDATRSAAEEAFWATRGGAAQEAANAAVGRVLWTMVRAARRAAGTAAWWSIYDAIWSGGGSTTTYYEWSEDAKAAANIAHEAMRDAQEKQLRKMLTEPQQKE